MSQKIQNLRTGGISTFIPVHTLHYSTSLKHENQVVQTPLWAFLVFMI